MDEARQRANAAAEAADDLRAQLRAAGEEGEAAARRIAALEAQLVEALAAEGRWGLT